MTNKKPRTGRFDNLDSPAMALGAAVVRQGFRLDGPDYATFPCGRGWAAVLGLDAWGMYQKGSDGTAHADIPYKAVKQCRHLPEDSKTREHKKCRHGITGEQITRESRMPDVRED